MTSLAAPDFAYICRLVRERSAIVLEPGKEYLALSRLEPLARTAGLSSVGELVGMLRRPGSMGLQEQVVDAMTTNETSFFRDVHPFESLRADILPELVERNAATRRIQIWCAAASTGQEPYTVALVVRQHFPELASWDVRIRATDLSPTVLAKAEAGRFTQLEVNRGLPAALLVKWFRRAGAQWEISPEIRRMVTFERHNLSVPWPATAPVDLLFLRNVLIYFDLETKRGILRQVRRALRPGGYLLLGGSETTLTLDDTFERVPRGRTAWYRSTTR
ncbi:MAG: protein-glutamate O-methyltransferase CheR [Acidimicrobiia bacterium]|nr:protein-glutamate O-methyltransferase CheR [Acidimicrobiia bacterium]